MRLISISRRVYRSILTVSIVCVIAMVTTVLLVNEDLERTMLNVEFTQERDFILMNNTGDDVFVWDTLNLAILFVPNGKPRPAAFPKVFENLPDNYSEEVTLDDQTYLVTNEQVDSGVLYVAKNITHFEQREILFQIALIIIALIIIAFSLLLAVFSSRRIVKPLRLLAQQINSTPVGPSMPHIQVDYTDEELHSIASTFNRFLDELESYVKREQSLLSLASHELRTPIAVMSGALDILEQRNQLQANDRATLIRLRRSCDEMRDNVNILLKLARRESFADNKQKLDIQAIAQDVVNDLKISHAAGERVQIYTKIQSTTYADPIMVKLLLRNLIQNALQHTTNNIKLKINKNSIEIQDYGSGLNQDQKAILIGQKKMSAYGATLSGLGLYIVTLMTERLGWQLDIVQTDTNGTRIELKYTN